MPSCFTRILTAGRDAALKGVTHTQMLAEVRIDLSQQTRPVVRFDEPTAAGVRASGVSGNGSANYKDT